jgi:hypothetical protein
MRILGKGSLASFLKICLDISYYVLLVGIGLAASSCSCRPFPTSAITGH